MHPRWCRICAINSITGRFCGLLSFWSWTGFFHYFSFKNKTHFRMDFPYVWTWRESHHQPFVYLSFCWNWWFFPRQISYTNGFTKQHTSRWWPLFMFALKLRNVFCHVWRFFLRWQNNQPTITTRWAPTSYKLCYNSTYNGYFTPVIHL